MSDPFAGLPKEEVGKKLDQILEEVSSYSVDIEEDPTLPELGTRYLQRVLSTCRNYTNRVTFYLQATMRLDKALKSEIRLTELDLEFKVKAKLADDPLVRQQSSIEDRKAVAFGMLRAESECLDALRVRLVDIEETVKILKMKHGELLRTSADIKLQRSIVKDDKDSQLRGDEGYSKPQAAQDRSVPEGMPPAVSSDPMNPVDILGCGATAEDLPAPVDNVHARQIQEFLNGPSEKSGDLCSICGEPQSMTPSGAHCRNGHGGADPLLPGQVPMEKKVVDAVATEVPAVEDEPLIRSVSYADLID